MTKIQCSEELEVQAKYWLWRIEQGLSQQERQALVAWANQDNSHHQALHRYSRSLKTSKSFTELNGLFPLEKQTYKAKNALFSRLSVAISIIIFTVITGEVFFNNVFTQYLPQKSQAIVYQHFSTNIGEQTSFSLPDGSLVQLNTNSLLTISFSDNHRQLNLIRGEALFNVAKDKSRPFSVSSGQQSFTALGTIFNIQKSDNNHLELIVTEGRVLIADSNEPLSTLFEKMSNAEQQVINKRLVIAGEKAIIINEKQLQINKISSQALSQELAWQQNMLIFDGESLTAALNEVSRYTNITFTIDDPKLARIKVAGYFRTGDIEALLDSLSYSFDLEYKKTNNNNIIISKATMATHQAVSVTSTM
jgi:transmembrane sensor